MNKLSLEKTEKIREESKQSEYTNVIMLGHCCIKNFPIEILQLNTIQNLKRLDLSHNYIIEIPSSISVLVNLKELWLSNNPIEIFPKNIEYLTKLELIDINNTKIKTLPTEIALLEHLYEVDWRNTPLSAFLFETYEIIENDIFQLRTIFNQLHTRKVLEIELFEYLYGEHFIMDADRPGIKEDIKILVQNISNVFDDLSELKQYVRRVSKLLPDRIDAVKATTVEQSKQLFIDFRRETDRSRLAADVEIKLRGMYFDRIERSEVTAVLDSIYQWVISLEDMQFLVQYASLLLPSEPKQATGELIWNNITNLQTDLINKREAAINTLSAAMYQIYPEQLPDAVKEKAQEIAILLQVERFATKKELTKLSQLSAECSKVLPPDFASFDAHEVLQSAQTIIFKR